MSPDRQPSLDPLDDPDPAGAARAAAMDSLMRCYVRELGISLPDNDSLVLDLTATGLRLTIPVLYPSATGWHRFGAARLAGGQPADPALLAAALAREATARLGRPSHDSTEIVARTLDSLQRTAVHLDLRRKDPSPPPGEPAFLTAERALLLGHPFHPAPKSRPEASAAELARYSPELRGSFPLHWFAAHSSIVAGDSAVGQPVQRLMRQLLPSDTAIPAGFVPVAAHPWQARELVATPAVAALLEDGMVRDLGQTGPSWCPTSSVRTVYLDGASFMLKLSLGMQITNSRRNNKRSELRLGAAMARLLAAGMGDALHRTHPGFRILRDPAWVSVNVADAADSGFETALRDNPSGRFQQAVCVSGLIAERPGLGPSQLAETISAQAAASGNTLAHTSIEWFDRYLSTVLIPQLWLYGTFGVALEAHHQNTVILLDDDGRPAAAWYRDSQGYYLAESHRDRTGAMVPDLDRLPLVFGDALVDERLTYYLLVNNLLGLIGAFGAQGLADEHALLTTLRRALLQEATSNRLPVVQSWLDAATLPCKANYLTGVDGRDELVGAVEEQSVYVRIPNPLREVRA